MRFGGVSVVILCSAVVLWPVSVQSANGSCGYERCFGAIAVAPSGKTGWSAGQRTAPGATRLAQDNCGEECAEVELFWNSCGVIAINQTGDWAFGWDEDQAVATNKALDACSADGAQCYVRDWACSK
ncbi:DUF4189 domain-containing protein [Puniceibacterium sp. IMCC21224]|uniref:DUF4189 domain-containing protein n=1 Tax=Puniceibacterium sp. IMCC21224 TaxID=1618204 RepID=UPI00064DAC7A|nr:DUF4189 domain-containing protein [Puniceibacterium sp. IMCC21224]KMK66406.1 protein of unknown function (DUF4189) [Puniceibacterium sp. IMCC21224]